MIQNQMKHLATLLPDYCYDILPSNGQIIKIKFGESGYYPQPRISKESAYPLMWQLNRERNVTPLQAEAMTNGSMFGWQVPAASPEYLQRMYDGLASERAIADSNIVAAAPELLAALRDLSESFKAHYEDYDTHANWIAAQDAIAKAEGKQ